MLFREYKRDSEQAVSRIRKNLVAEKSSLEEVRDNRTEERFH
jgi:hypothetical protein